VLSIEKSHFGKKYIDTFWIYHLKYDIAVRFNIN
jgi:hypothetical protein